MRKRWNWLITIGLLLVVLCLPLPGHAADQLVDIQTIAPDILLDMRYATANNFLKEAVYPEATCLLRSATAHKLAAVQADLAKRNLGLKVFDCYRPLSVQRRMWAILPDSDYVANPKTGSQHNRGAAVDVSLVDRSGNSVEMPSEFDDFSKRAHSDNKAATVTAKENRHRLRSAMLKQGFKGITSEWWHFDDTNWRRYGLLDVDL
jgi:zinc D-Ala-D-Ala dipeptidase